MSSDSDNLVSIAACASIAEATVLKTALEESGIEAVVNGDSLNSAFGNVGPSLSDAKLLVRQEDAAAAVSIVRATRESFSSPRQDPWFCGKCLEEVEGGFEVCWSCGLARDETEAPFPATADVIESVESPSVDTESLGRSSSNPYESPRAMGTSERDEDDELDPEVQAMEANFMLGLIFSAGSVFIPILPALAAIAMFRFAFRKKLKLTTNAQVAFVAAILILIVTHLGWFWVWQSPSFR